MSFVFLFPAVLFITCRNTALDVMCRKGVTFRFVFFLFFFMFWTIFCDQVETSGATEKHLQHTSLSAE